MTSNLTTEDVSRGRLTVVTPFGRVVIPNRPDAAIALSGGVDSSILLYVMAEQLNMRPRVFFLENANSSYEVAARVLHWINLRVNTNLLIESLPRVTEGDWLRHDVEHMATLAPVIYTGVTGNPPVDFGERPPNRPQPGLGVRFVTPFLALDKRASVYLYRQFNVWDLMSLTHSCTRSFTHACGKCFQCQEKEWALREVTL